MKERPTPRILKTFQLQFRQLLRDEKLMESVLEDEPGYGFKTPEMVIFEGDAVLSAKKHAIFNRYTYLRDAGLDAMAGILIKENVVIFKDERIAG